MLKVKKNVKIHLVLKFSLKKSQKEAFISLRKTTQNDFVVLKSNLPFLYNKAHNLLTKC